MTEEIIKERIIKNETEISSLKEFRKQDVEEHKRIFDKLSRIEVLVAKLPQELIDIMNNKFSGKFVTKEEFNPVKWIVYGLTGIILTGAITALITLIFK